MNQVHFLDYYRYREFLKKLQESACFPQCRHHPFGIDRISGYLDERRNNGTPLDVLMDAGQSLAMFAGFLGQNPQAIRFEMLREYDFSRFLHFFVPLFHPSARDNRSKLLAIFDDVVDYCRHILASGAIGSIAVMISARTRIFDQGSLHRLPKLPPTGPEWVMVKQSKTGGEQLVITFNDLWLLLVFRNVYGLDEAMMREDLQNPEVYIEDRLPKTAHLVRLLKNLRRNGYTAETFTLELSTERHLTRAKSWFYRERYVAELSESPTPSCPIV